MTAVTASAQLYVGAGYSYSPTKAEAEGVKTNFDRNGVRVLPAELFA